jgi:peptidyl-prolyl cis-trans isomerase B (cyclophilin B)
MPRLWIARLLILLVTLLVAASAAAQEARSPAQLCEAALPVADPSARLYTAPEQVLQAGVDYRAIFCTESGPIYVDLYEDYAPLAVNSFVFLAERGYFNNTTFHRVLEGFMAQGGDPTATGSGGPGYEFANEAVGFLTFNAPGVLAMANAGPNTNGSQFFITTGAAPHLGYDYSIFGGVLEGDASTIRLRDPNVDTAPGARLDTVLLITDPATVQTTFTPPVAPTSEEVLAAMSGIQQLIPPEIADTLTLSTALQTTEEALAGEPEAGRASLEALFSAHQHNYRVNAVISNSGCDFNRIDFAATSYTLDAYASKAAAAAALADPALTALATAEGYGEAQFSPDLATPYYLREQIICDQAIVTIMTNWQRERFLASVTIGFPASNTDLIPALPRILSQVVGLNFYEAFLGDVFLRELQQTP